MKRNILIIEDDRVLNQLIVQHVRSMGHDVTGVRSWNDAQTFLKDHEPHLVLMDVRLPDSDGLQRLPELVEQQPVIVLTAYGSVREAVDAMKAGAAEYLSKPVSADELRLVIQRALEHADLRNQHHFCMRRLREKERVKSLMVGASSALAQVREMIEAVAPSDMTVLIQGQSGTGKELVARALHDNSPRAGRSFVAVDCCTLQEKLFESEVFGHEKGAFTGADRQKKGLIEGAEGGTLFLDEIGEIEPAIQAKLLRVLETGKFRRLGGTKDLNANVRVVAATNRNLEAVSEEGGFRPDLYFRLSTFIIQTPPLRDRREDIPHLVKHFLAHHRFSGRISKTVSAQALRKLVSYDWPGNVRELKNVVERAIILSRDKARILPEHLAFGSRGGKNGAQLTLSFDRDPTMEELQAEYLRIQLKKYSGHRATVAESLNISERNVYRLIKRFGLEEPSFASVGQGRAGAA